MVDGTVETVLLAQQRWQIPSHQGVHEGGAIASLVSQATKGAFDSVCKDRGDRLQDQRVDENSATVLLAQQRWQRYHRTNVCEGFGAIASLVSQATKGAYDSVCKEPGEMELHAGSCRRSIMG